MDSPRLTDEVYTVGEVASLFKVTKKAVYDWMSEGKLVYFYVGGQRRITKEAILAFLASSEEAGRHRGENAEESFLNNKAPLLQAA
jgi:excisionase family DNA binding protein